MYFIPASKRKKDQSFGTYLCCSKFRFDSCALKPKEEVLACFLAFLYRQAIAA